MFSDLKEIIGLIGFKESIIYIKEIPLFYLHPYKTFKQFFQKSENIKLAQTIFYLVIGVILFYLLLEDTPIKRILKILIFEILILLVPLIFLSINNWILSKFFNSNFKNINIFLYLVLVKFLLYPFILLAYFLFQETEYYMFLFIFWTIAVIANFLFWFFSSIFFYKSLIINIVSFLLNVIAFNVFIVLIILVFDFVTGDKKNGGESYLVIDKINQEYEKTTRIINKPEKFKQLKLIVEHGNQKAVFFLESKTYFHVLNTSELNLDEIYSSSDSIEKCLKTNLLVIDSIFNNLNYTSTKEFLTDEKIIYKSYLKELSMRTPELRYLIRKREFAANKSTAEPIVCYVLNFNRTNTDLFNDYKLKVKEFEDKAEFAMTPIIWFSYIVFILYFNIL